MRAEEKRQTLEEALGLLVGILIIAAVAFALYGIFTLLGLSGSSQHCELIHEGLRQSYICP